MRLVFALVLLAACSSARSDEPVAHEGQVLIKNEECLIVKGDQWAGWVCFKRVPDCKEGDIVRIAGSIHPYKWTRQEILNLQNIEVLGTRPLPPTHDVAGHEIFDGRMLFEFVRVRGALVSVAPGERGWLWAIIRTPTGDVGVTIRESYHSYEEIHRLLDAEIALRGIVVYSWGSEQRLGAHVSERGDNALEVLTPPPIPFASPAFSSTAATHRQTLTGTVLARGESRLVIHSPEHGVVQAVPSAGTVLPDVGRRVTIAGFAETDPVHLRFREALCRDEGPGRPDNITPRIPSATKLADGLLHGETITIEGTVLGLSGTGAPGIFSVACPDYTIHVDASAVGIPPPDLPRPESTVRVTGIALSEYENASTTEIFPRLRRLVILPRHPSDVTILRTPPWWTPTKFVFCLLALAILYGLREFVSRSLTRIKLRERTLLSVDIHDTLAQHLTGVSLQLDGVELAETAHRPDLARVHLASARQALRSCRENLRYCLGDLRSNLPDASDMNAFIREIVRPHIGSATLAVRIAVPRRVLSDKQAYAIGCIIRELSVNAVRHGKASRIFIAGERRNKFIRLSVHDNGCGFDPMHCPGVAEGHFGLVGIRERLKPLQGEMQISSRPNHGTRILVSIPLQP